ncbi:hypothetical protein CAPTEDRAFT_210817 [Capitella teleta]|uniref:Farnesoic acid O-methyl transferase domain-containing protein n=1 Tax=Capitella teleta TaxID=283909 RepID=R7U1K3_CAPTE|nr:hypothetical protein CAPTEDRAFT_210817 [Capitella teleta]|eukprot:ELT99834.1 hypothetical protein CAPTEDRAFT_210817 [Capitella teleta]
MRILLILTLFLLADLTLGNVDMCYLTTLEGSTSDVYIPFVNLHPENDHFFVGVKGCKDVRIRMKYEFDYYEILLGSYRYGHTAEVLLLNWKRDEMFLLFRSHKTVLDCNRMKYFWVKISGSELSFGTGLNVGNGTLKVYEGWDVNSSLLQDIEFGIGVESSVTEFERQCGNVDMCYLTTLEGSTSDVYIPFVNPHPENDHFFVGGKGCKDVRIRMKYEFGYYEILLGSYRYEHAAEVILLNWNKGKMFRLFRSHKNVLDCNRMKYFWVKISGSELSFGIGLNVGNGTLKVYKWQDVNSSLFHDIEVGIGAERSITEFESQCG